MPCRSVRTVSPAIVHGAHPEELQLLERAAVELLDDRPGVGALDLEAPQVAGDGLAVRPRGRPGVVADLDVVAAGLALELQPVGAGGAADVDVLLLVEAEEDAVTDDVAGGGDGDELLGHVHREVGHAVDAGVGDQLDRVRAAHEQVEHVVGLVEEHGGLLPGLLLPPPVGELRGDHRVDVGAELGVAQQADGVAGLVEEFLKVLGGHVRPFSSGVISAGRRSRPVAWWFAGPDVCARPRDVPGQWPATHLRSRSVEPRCGPAHRHPSPRGDHMAARRASDDGTNGSFDVFVGASGSARVARCTSRSGPAVTRRPIGAGRRRPERVPSAPRRRPGRRAAARSGPGDGHRGITCPQRS